MPLQSLPYNRNYGEWYPYNNGNYSQRARSLFFFHSLNHDEVIGPSEITFETTARYRPTASNINVWPSDVSGPKSFWSDGTEIYRVFLRESSINVILTSPPEGSPQEDYDIALAYQAALHEYLDGTVTSKLQWGSFEPDDGSGGLLPPIDLSEYATKIEPRPFPYVFPFDQAAGDDNSYDMIRGGTSPTTGDPNNFPFTEGDEYNVQRFFHNTPDELDGPGTGMEIRSTGGLVEWNPEGMSTVTIEGTFAKSPENIGNIGDIIKVDNANTNGVPDDSPYNGRSFKILDKWEYTVTGGANVIYYYYNVQMMDSEPFVFYSKKVYDSVVNVTKRPRLKIKYKLPTTNSDDDNSDDLPAATQYSFYSKYDADNNPVYLSWNGVATSINKLELDSYSETGDPIFVGSDKLTPRGGAMQFPNAHGKFHTGIFANYDGDQQRTTPWRKAYRYLNRFDTKSVVIEHTDGPNSDYGTSGKAKFNFKPDHVHKKDSAGGVAIEYPKSIPHRPPCLYSTQTATASRTIVVSRRITSTELIEGSWFDTEDNGDLRWGVYNIKQWIPNGGEGLVVEENSSPNKIYFTVNLEDNGNGSQEFPDYDYTGVISCKGTVVPAYSGEILQFDTNYGFMNSNYTNESIGLANVSAIIFDISETDEVLRWSGFNYNAAQHWRNTFDSVRVTNKRLAQSFTFTQYRSLLTNTGDDKTNYKVVMYDDSNQQWDTSSWNTDDDIEITFVNKKVIKERLESGNPEGMEYVAISYRPLEEEIIDDFNIPYDETIIPELRAFTIESDGLENGNITINYTGDASNITFKLFEQNPND